MDSITQATLGAAIGEALLGKKIGNKGAVIGAIVATIPDLDVALIPFYSSLQNISIHRGYSHSILFSIVGAFLIAYILSRISWTKAISKTKLWIFTWLALFTHILLDAFTTYGTQLFLPISDYRVSFDSINIVDPIYTLSLLTGLVFSLFVYKNRPTRGWYNRAGLIISSIYLIGTLGVKLHINYQFEAQTKKQNMPYQELLTVPVGFGSVNWYGVAKDSVGLYIGKYSLLKNNNIHFDHFPINDQLLEGLDENLVDRMKWFAQGFYTVAEDNGNIRIYNMQCDMQGVRTFGDYKAPTAFYFEIIPLTGGEFKLSSGMHPAK